MDFKIKPAGTKDLPLVLSFIKELAEFEKLSHEVTATEEVLRETLFGKDPVAFAILGYVDDKPAGFAIYFYNFSTFLGRPGIYLEDLFVRPEYRGQGIGRELLQYLAALAKKQKCGRFEWAVLDWNEKAIQFYKSLGAVPKDDWIIYRLSGDALEKVAAQHSLPA